MNETLQFDFTHHGPYLSSYTVSSGPLILTVQVNVYGLGLTVQCEAEEKVIWFSHGNPGRQLIHPMSFESKAACS